MLYHYFVKQLIRQSLEHVNNRRWDELLKSVAPKVHHRFAGAHAIGGERHDKETLRLWFERVGRGIPPCLCSGTPRQRCSTVMRRTSTGACM